MNPITIEAVPELGSIDPCELASPAPITRPTVAEAVWRLTIEYRVLVDVIYGAGEAGADLGELLDLVDDAQRFVELSRERVMKNVAL